MEQTSSDQELSGDQQPVLTITLPPLLPEVIETIDRVMQEHGGNVTHTNGTTIFIFPPGTKQQEIWPRTMTERYTITFPDRYATLWVHDIYNDQNNLFFPRDEFPADVQQKYDRQVCSL